MGFDTGFVKLGMHTIKGMLRLTGGRVSKQRYKELVTGVLAGVLAEHPDVSPTEARTRAEKATGNRVANDLFDLRTTASSAPAATSSPATKTTPRNPQPRRRPPAARKTAARRTTRKPTARKSTTKKTTRR